MVQTGCQMCLDQAPEITHTYKDLGFSRTQPNIPLALKLIAVPASTKYYKASVSVLCGQSHIVSSRSMRPSALARVLSRGRAGTQQQGNQIPPPLRAPVALREPSGVLRVSNWLVSLSVFSLHQACSASKRRTHRPSGMAAAASRGIETPNERKETECHSCGYMRWAG